MIRLLLGIDVFWVGWLGDEEFLESFVYGLGCVYF